MKKVQSSAVRGRLHGLVMDHINGLTKGSVCAVGSSGIFSWLGKEIYETSINSPSL